MKQVLAALAIAAGVWAPAQAQVSPQARLTALTDQVSQDKLHNTVATLVGFGTRHTLSDPAARNRGIGAARRWAKGQFEAYSAACGGCLTIVTPEQLFSGERRIPDPAVVQDVIAIQRGTADPDRVIIISGHIDSINSDVMNATDDAPGANDDASGVSAVLEAARVLSGQQFGATIVYAVLSGEEQGLYGGQILADYARAQGWRVEAQLNNDIIGNTRGSNGEANSSQVRVFSEGVRANETPEQAAARASTGGELDSPSRNLARFIDKLADDLGIIDVEMIYRTDRFGRGGDQIPMLEAGYPAVRVTEMLENYSRQHQTVREEDGVAYGDVIAGVDFDYLAKVVKLNIAALAALAWAPAPPDRVRLAGAVKPDTTVTWNRVAGAAAYEVWRRPTTAAQWTVSHRVGGDQSRLVLPGVIIDNWFFGVAAVSSDGFSSPVEFPGPIGAFLPPPPEEPAR